MDNTVTAFTWNDIISIVNSVTAHFTIQSAISVMVGIVAATISIYLTWVFGRKAIKALLRVFRGKSIRV